MLKYGFFRVDILSIDVTFVKITKLLTEFLFEIIIAKRFI